MDVLVLIDKLDDLVHNAKPVPLTDQVRVDKEEIYDILDQMRATIPEEIKQARWIVKERQEMLAEAKREQDRLLFVAPRQPVAAALHGGEELLQVDLERVEDLVGVVLGAKPDLALARARVLDDLVGGALGLLGHLFVGDQTGLLLTGLAHDPLGLAFGLGEHLLALLDDPARLLDLLGDRRPHLVEEVVDLLPIHTHLVRQGDGPRVVDHVIELVY